MVHRATFEDPKAEFKEGDNKFEKSAKLECFPPPDNKLLLIFDKPPRTNWNFPISESERHDDKEERIKAVPDFDSTGECKAVIDLYQTPPSANEGKFEAEFKLAGVEWKVKFKGNQIFPL